MPIKCQDITGYSLKHSDKLVLIDKNLCQSVHKCRGVCQSASVKDLKYWIKPGCMHFLYAGK